MENASSFDPASATSTPLRQLSAEQINQQRIPHSPSHNSYLSENEKPLYHRPRESTSSEVQAKVAFLNSLSNPSSPTKPGRGPMPPPSGNAALQRAMMAYEESQSTLSTASAEIERLKQEVNAGRAREMRVSQRLESFMESLQEEKQHREKERKYYVTEVKKCRKQTYQAELAQVEAREELKEARAELKRTQTEVAAEKHKKEEARKEAFERAYAVSGLTEELEMVKAQLKSAEKERDAAIQEAKTNATYSPHISASQQASAASTSEHVSQAHEKHMRFDENQDVDATPRAPKPSHSSMDGHSCRNAASNVPRPFSSEWVDFKAFERSLDERPFTLQDHIHQLYEELRYTKNQVKTHLDTIHLMNMECQMGCCACRVAEKKGKRFIWDMEYEQQMQAEHVAKRRKLIEDRKANTLPPEPSQIQSSTAEEAPAVEEAVQIPLPPESKDPSPEPTAMLEDMTQVLVEPSANNAQFTFSTSTSSHVHHRANPPPLLHTQSALDTKEPDLFDLSPPKHHPPRPSTSMGILTLQSPTRSPIRLVPDSPDPNTLRARSSTPVDNPPMTARSTRVPLKDPSPVGSHRRAQSRPNIRERGHARSPLVSSKSTTDLRDSVSTSPGANTAFPITPATKHARSQNQQTITTTTTIPLRDDEDGQSALPHTPASPSYPDKYSHSRTQPIHMLPPSTTHGESEAQSETQMINAPGTPVSREAALAQIRARRDRARSINLKQTANGAKSAPGSARRGITLRDAGALHGGVVAGRGEREVSVASLASAPGRF